MVLKGKVKRAEVILKRVSEVNGKEMPKDDLMEPEDQTRIGDVRDLFSSKLMARKTLLSWYIWLVYYAEKIDLDNFSCCGCCVIVYCYFGAIADDVSTTYMLVSQFLCRRIVKDDFFVFVGFLF